MADRDRDPPTAGPTPTEPASLSERLRQLEGNYRSWAESHHVKYFGRDASTPPPLTSSQAPIDVTPVRVEDAAAAYTPPEVPIPAAAEPQAQALPPAANPEPIAAASAPSEVQPEPLEAAAMRAEQSRAAASAPIEGTSKPLKSTVARSEEPSAAAAAPAEITLAPAAPAKPEPVLARAATPEPIAAPAPEAAPIELPPKPSPIELPRAEEKAPAKAKSEAAKPAEPTAPPAQEGGEARRPDLTRRTRDLDFREALTKGLNAARGNLITVFAFSQVLNILLLAMPLFLFQISDRVLTSRSTETLIMLSIIVVGALLAHSLLDVFRRNILMRVATDVECKLGAPVLAAAAKASQAGSSREFQTLGDLQHIRGFLTGPVILTMMDAPVAPLFLAAVFLIHWQLGVIVGCAAIALLIVAFFNQRATAVPYGHAQAYAVRAALQTEAMARNSQAMNAMGMIPEGVQMWGRDTVESLKAQTIAQDRNILFTGLSKFIRLATQVTMLGWGAWLALNHSLTGGMLIAASIVASRALAPLEGTIEGWKSFVQARAAYGRIRALLQSSPLNLERLRLPRPVGKLTVERLLYVPPPTKKVILNGISFELNPGDSLAIVGASGMGKSTLARMLVGSITPTAGNVRLDSMDLRNWDPRQFGESVGYLPQDVQLFPATIKANIARMREDADDEAIFDAAELADVHEMIAQFPQGYETMIQMDGSPLSGGQKQRIGLARAFFGNPRLVVLDEPNSNLDAAGERALASALTRARSKGMTIVAVTQRPSLLNSVDKIMIIKDGTIQAMGPRDQMLAVLNGQGRRPQQDAGARQVLEPVFEG